jgi:hypothetical protein
MTRTYRLPNGDRLVDERWVAVTGFSLESDGRLALSDGSFIEPRCFVVTSVTGERKRFYGPPKTSALDDYFYLLDVYYVKGSSLRSAMVELGGPPSKWYVRLSQEQTVIEGLAFDPCATERRFADPALERVELDELVRSAVETLDRLAGSQDEQSAYEASEWVELLAKVATRSELALECLVRALDDDRAYDEGAGNPYGSYVQKVSDHAQSALYSSEVRARALPVLLSALDRLSAAGRVNAARVLGWYASSAQTALAALERLASDPDELVRKAAAIELKTHSALPSGPDQ